MSLSPAALFHCQWSWRPCETDYYQGGKPDSLGSAWIYRVRRAGRTQEPGSENTDTWSRRASDLRGGQQDSEGGGGGCLQEVQRAGVGLQGSGALHTSCAPSPLLEAGDSAWGCRGDSEGENM